MTHSSSGRFFPALFGQLPTFLGFVQSDLIGFMNSISDPELTKI